MARSMTSATPSARLARPTPSGADLLDAIKDAQQALMVRLIPRVVKHGLGNHAFWPLWYLGRGAEPHPSDLAHRMGISGPTCTAIVDQLVDGGFVARRRSSDDRRQVVLAITPKGRRTLEAIWGEMESTLGQALEDLPAEGVRVTARTLRDLAQRVRAEPPSPLAEADA
jgi:DNA-binding MarR family transcriptional regulator